MNLQTWSWEAEGNEIVLLPTRGRVLQVRIAGEPTLWENPNWSGDWNVGGDRLWLGPEIDWFWKKTDRPDIRFYDVPSSIDDDQWVAESSGSDCCKIRKAGRIDHQRTDHYVEFELTRAFSRVALPALNGFESAIAYETVNQLQLLDGTPGQPMDLWSLLQMPSGGRMFVSVLPKSQFRNHYEPIPNARWTDNDGLMELQVSGSELYKIGLAPDSVLGRMAYVRESSNGDYLVIYRNITPQFRRPYCDVPLSEPDSQGDAIQIFYDGGRYGQMGEIEHHSPALVAGSGDQTLEDRCLTVVGRVAKEDWPAWRAHWLG